jgi:hypothetical protein
MSKSPSVATLKKLFSLSGNRCAYPDCGIPNVDTATGTLIGQVCHIKARGLGEPRFDPDQTDDERHGFDNLIILCGRHHTIIDDDEDRFPVVRLLEMKRAHEALSSIPIEVDIKVAEQLAAVVQVALPLN